MNVKIKLGIIPALALLAACGQNTHIAGGNDSSAISDNDTSARNISSGNGFSTTLSFQKTSFLIESRNLLKDNTITISPSGLTKDNNPVVAAVDGHVYKAEIGDLNQDGFPELAIYSRNNTSDSTATATVLGNNKGKSLSLVYLGEIADNEKASAGFSGHDSFEISNGFLYRSFMTYENGKPTGITRRIRYTLQPGEAAYQLKIAEITEY